MDCKGGAFATDCCSMDASTPVPDARRQQQQQRRQRWEQQRRQQHKEQLQRHKQQQQQQEQQEESWQEPPPENTLQTKAVQVIGGVLITLSELEERVKAFQGQTKADKEYRKLEEMVTRQLLLLDSVEAGGQDSIRKQRKKAVQRSNVVLDLLEKTIQDNQAQGAQEGESENLEEETTDFAQRMNSILLELEKRVDAFQGRTKADKEHQNLEDLMTRQLVLQDSVEMEDLESICQQRREELKETVRRYRTRKHQEGEGENLQKKATEIIRVVMKTLSKVETKVKAFEGQTKEDKKYRKLEVLITSQLLLLKSVESGGLNSIRKQKKMAVQLTNAVRDLLEKRIQDNQAQGAQEGEGENLQKKATDIIGGVMDTLLELAKGVKAFQGQSKEDREYRKLEELLTRQLLLLDSVETGGQDNIRQERKEAVRLTSTVLDLLEEIVHYNQARGQQEGDGDSSSSRASGSDGREDFSSFSSEEEQEPLPM